MFKVNQIQQLNLA